MSLLYKKSKDVTYDVNVIESVDNINFLFYSDCGKHGTDELLAEYNLTIKELLDILQANED